MSSPLSDYLDVALWSVQSVLAIQFLVTGVMHAFRIEASQRRMPWARDSPRMVLKIDGAAEILGAFGLLLPRLLNVLPVLTPLAAIGLAIIMVIGTVVHARRKETRNMVVTVLLFVLAVFVAYGRFFLVT